MNVGYMRVSRNKQTTTLQSKYLLYVVNTERL